MILKEPTFKEEVVNFSQYMIIVFIVVWILLYITIVKDSYFSEIKLKSNISNQVTNEK